MIALTRKTTFNIIAIYVLARKGIKKEEKGRAKKFRKPERAKEKMRNESWRCSTHPYHMNGAVVW